MEGNQSIYFDSELAALMRKIREQVIESGNKFNLSFEIRKGMKAYCRQLGITQNKEKSEKQDN